MLGTFMGTLLEREDVTYIVQQMESLRQNSSGIYDEEIVFSIVSPCIVEFSYCSFTNLCTFIKLGKV